jgi:hypothetical protein
MAKLEYHILLTLTCLAPVFIGCILALYLRQYVLWQKYYRLKTHLNLIEKDLQALAIVNRLVIKNSKAPTLRVIKSDTDN